MIAALHSVMCATNGDQISFIFVNLIATRKVSNSWIVLARLDSRIDR